MSIKNTSSSCNLEYFIALSTLKLMSLELVLSVSFESWMSTKALAQLRNGLLMIIGLASCFFISRTKKSIRKKNFSHFNEKIFYNASWISDWPTFRVNHYSCRIQLQEIELLVH